MTAYALAAMMLCGTTGLENGSLIVLENSNKPVAIQTNSKITHVAVLLQIGGNPWVYEATPDKVRCLPLSEYREELGQLNRWRRKRTRMWVLAPKRPYSKQELIAMKSYMDAQLGRRYSVKGYVRGREADGIHCAEFASTALERTGRINVEREFSVAPGFLVREVAAIHEPAVELPITAQKPQESWCSRAWERWANFNLWCRWACYETWMFCR